MRALRSGVICLICGGMGLSLGCSMNCKAETLTFSFFQYPGTTITDASGINNSGQVDGFAAEVPNVTADPAGFVYQNGSFTPLIFGNSGTFANGINNLGIVVGVSGAGSFLYNTSTGIYTPFSGAGAHGINDLGQIVGSTAGNGYFYDGSTFHTISFAGATTTSALGINNAGVIVGSYMLGGTTFGFLDSGGVFQSFSVPGAQSTVITDINNNGDFIGYFVDPTLQPPSHRGFVVSGGNLTIFDPAPFPHEDPGTTPGGINDYGVIAGYWQPRAGAESFIATPTPEPGTLGLLGTGILMLAGMARGRLRATMRG